MKCLIFIHFAHTGKFYLVLLDCGKQTIPFCYTFTGPISSAIAEKSTNIAIWTKNFLIRELCPQTRIRLLYFPIGGSASGPKLKRYGYTLHVACVTTYFKNFLGNFLPVQIISCIRVVFLFDKYSVSMFSCKCIPKFCYTIFLLSTCEGRP